MTKRYIIANLNNGKTTYYFNHADIFTLIHKATQFSSKSVAKAIIKDNKLIRFGYITIIKVYVL